MALTRRAFVQLSAGAAALSAAGLISGAGASEPAKDAPKESPKGEGVAKAGKPLSILILGGTGFLGPNVIAAAKARGHSVTLFNRGRTQKRKGTRFDKEDKLVGNRDPNLHSDTKWVGEGATAKQVEDESSPKGLSQIAEAIKEGRKWDAVVDTSGMFPRIVRASAELLAPATGQYVFISTISVLASHEPENADENSPTGKIEDEAAETMGPSMSYYGPLKALCEQAAEKAMPGRVTNIRPGFIVGPDDNTDRFTYWCWRGAQGGRMLVPGTPEDPVQFIDGRDLGRFIIECIERKSVGVYNATGGVTPHRWGDVVRTFASVGYKSSGKTVEPVWVSEAELAKLGGLPLPIWVPPSGGSKGFHRVNCAKAIAAGLRFSPVETTVRDTLAWIPTELERRARATVDIKKEAKDAGRSEPQMSDPMVLRAGLTLEAEAEVLEKLKGK
jgi:2'-hydroxyisoflavone reductase